MNDLQNLYLNLGDKLFEQGSCEEALTCYQKAYEQGGGCPEALSRIRKQYVLPHEESFRQNLSNRCGAMDFSIQCEDCQIDFLPVSDRKYVLFDQEAGSFCGSFDLKDYEDKKENDKTFQSVLIADNWDAREVLTILNQRIWNNIYIVLNDSFGKFMSFFKLPGFASLLSENVHIFENTEKMCRYFAENPGAYLPHVIHAPDQKGYEEIVDEIHHERIQGGIRSDNVFLSICIPSYNRGKLALEAVQHALKTKYDSEVEIFVSNNGSNVDVEEYRIIQNMGDSRIRYFEYEKNEGFKANIFKCLKEAKGQFAFLQSDEDLFDITSLEAVFDYLLNAQDLGVCRFNPSKSIHNPWKILENATFKKGGEAFNWASNYKYFTGYCYNVHYLKRYEIIKQLEGMTSRYIEDYCTCGPMCLLAEVSNMEDSEISAWHYRGPSKTGGNIGTEICVSEYTKISARMEYQEDILRLAEERLELEDYKIVVLSCSHRTLSVISARLVQFKEKLMEEYNCSWPDICIEEYKRCLMIISESKWGIEAFDETFFHDLDEVFFDWLDCRRIRPVYSEEENFKATLRAQVARYYYDHGVPFLEIDFKGIDKRLDGVIGQAMPGGQSN